MKRGLRAALLFFAQMRAVGVQPRHQRARATRVRRDDATGLVEVACEGSLDVAP